MIASLNGDVEWIGDDSIVVRVGGVGLQVSVPVSVLDELDGVVGPIHLITHLVVREDALTLYGFSSMEERRVFLLLLGVSGVGPRLALAVLSTLTIEMLANAVEGEQPEVISRVPGVGKKTAQKIVLELKGKLFAGDLPSGLGAIASVDTDVVEVLTSMGFSIVEAQAAIQSIPKDTPDDIEERVRIALSYFSD